ncbi:hypothetical protein ACQ4PT_049026 [Festuca glaucescens]
MNRRVVNLLVNNLSGRRPTFSLHRIDPASLFRPTGSPKPADPAAINKAAAINKDPAPARLPPAAVSFSPRNEIGWMDFLAFKDDVIAVDHEGRTLLYDGEVGAVRVMNPMVGPRCGSISLPLGDNFFFVMAREELGWSRQVHHCQVLCFRDWLWHPLEQLPFDELDLFRDDPSFHKSKLGLEQLDPFELGAYTGVGDSEIWISTVGAGTFSFNASKCGWSKIGDWALPFSGRAHYVAEHGLWFGFSDDHLCAADLRQEPPAPPLRKFPLLHLWEEEPPVHEAWTPTSTSLFPLGSGKLCIARCFRTTDGVKLLPSDYGHEKAKRCIA